VNVRRLQPGDQAQWDELWQGYLVFYEHQLDAATTDRTWGRFFEEDSPVVGLGAFEGDDDLVGICHLVIHASTWSVAPYCYLNDLFVRPDRRVQGVGRTLIAAATDEARAAGASKIYWQTHTDNATARRLYDQVAENLGFIVYEAQLDD
jgi:GNAT superfamily N-acetyltransferase